MGDSSETGRILKDARVAAGRSLADLAQETRINARYLAEIEEGSAFSLPAIYRKTFIRTYARALGIDPDTLPAPEPEAPQAPAVKDVPVIAPGPPVDEIVTSRLERNPFVEKSQIRTMVVVVALLVTALVFSVKWFISEPEDTGNKPPAHPDTAVASVRERPPAVVSTATVTDSLILSATATESVWVHIVIDNDSIVDCIIPPAQGLDLRARDNFILAVGNPAGLSVSLNGRKMEQVGKGKRPVKNIVLSRKSLID